MLPAIIQAAEWFFFTYLAVLYAGYALLNVAAIFRIRRYLDAADVASVENVYASLDMPVSVIIPAYNESTSIVSSVKAMQQLHYPTFEIIVVNDGSSDDTLERLIEAFELRPFPEAYRKRLDCRRVRGVYRSARHPGLSVIDKENGGSKADALNAGINACRYPLFCAVDADSILQPDSLRRAVAPFLEDPDMIATGGTVRIANGCEISGGFLSRVGLPTNPLALMQIVEYLRGFLFGRMGWAEMNSVLIISGAFGVFDKEAVVSVGGYNRNAIGEDMELIVRLHRRFRREGRRYRITFVPDPICWTDAPEDLLSLSRQRLRWQHGLGQSLQMHREMIFDRRAGAVGMIAMPFFLLFELFGPAVELAGYAFMAVAALSGWIDWETGLTFFALAVGLGILLSASALMLDEMSFHVYPRTGHLLLLFLVAIGENFGYRQLTLVWRIRGLWQWSRGHRPTWEAIRRTDSLGRS